MFGNSSDYVDVIDSQYPELAIFYPTVRIPDMVNNNPKPRSSRVRSGTEWKAE